MLPPVHNDCFYAGFQNFSSVYVQIEYLKLCWGASVIVA